MSGSKISSDPRRRELLASALAALGLGPGCDRVVVTEHSPVEGLTELTEEGELGVPTLTSNADFYIYHVFETPTIDVATWSFALRFGDRVVAEWTAEDLEALPVTEFEATLECIGSQPGAVRMGNAVWGGIRLADLLDRAGLTPPSSAVELRIVGVDTYDAALPLDLVADGIWVVWQMNGEPLPHEHGAPARLIVPGRYGIKNVKWLQEIAASDEPVVGFWDTNGGWSHGGEIRLHGFILVPMPYSPVQAGPQRILGTAFAGNEAIAKVEVSIGDGPYQEAVIDYSPSPTIWTLWHLDWEPVAGTTSVQVKVTTASGRVCNLDPAGTNPLDGYDAGQRTEVNVL